VLCDETQFIAEYIGENTWRSYDEKLMGLLFIGSLCRNSSVSGIIVS